MKIKVDKEASNLIEQLCDIALKNGGIQNLNAINIILKSMEIIKGEKMSKGPIKK